ncbi:MAG: alpha/beta fold hydrolase, partial [Bacteroidota bacterium]
GQSDNWNTLAKNFFEKNFHVYTLDQRNHGLSAHADEWDYKSMAEDLNEFIEDHQIKNPILLGHSMGGKTLLFFQWLFPGKAKKLIVVDIAARSYEPHHQQVLAALNAVDFNLVQSRKEAELILNQHIEDFGTKQFLLKNIYRKDLGITVLDWRFNLKVIHDRYDNIGVAVPFYNDDTPTLIVKGEKSNYINAFDIEDFKKRFSRLTFQEIEGAAHWVHAEKPQAFFDVVYNFITT